MRVAALSDIHGNLPALEAVLQDLAGEEPDLIVVCGDVASGPLPVETLEILRSLPNARFLHGNADRGLVAAYDNSPKPKWAGPAADWCASQLSREDRDFLASFPDVVRIDVEGLGRILFCHGSPRNDEEMMMAATPEPRLREIIAGVDTDVIVCGHTHMQFDRTSDGVRIVNPGSVGMPYGEPGACWALFGPEIDFRRTDSDREGAAARIRKSSWLGAPAFARDNVLSVPSVAEVMEFVRNMGGP